MNSNLARRSGVLAEAVIVVAIFAVVSWLGYNFFYRIDTTQKKQYTISTATKKVLAKLDDPVNVEVFMSHELPPQLVPVSQEVRNKLDEYQRYSHGKFKVRYTDPGDDEKEKERATNLGVQEVQVQVLERDQQVVKKIFFGLVLNFVDKKAAIGQIFQSSTLEYDLTSRLMKFTMKDKPKIGLFAGPLVFNQQGQQQQGPSFQGIKQILSGGDDSLYDVVEIDPQKDQTLPDGLSAMIVAGAFNMSDNLKYSLDQYLMKGGQVLLLLDPMMQTGQQMGGLGQAFPSLPTIEDQVEKYGVKFNKKLIADPDGCADAAFRAGMFTLQQPYALWPKIGPKGTNQEVGAIAQVAQTVLPWCCPLTTLEKPNVKYTPLFKTSDTSFLIESPFNLEPDQRWDYRRSESAEHGPFTVAWLVSGAINSAFTSPPAVKPPAPDSEGKVAAAASSPFDASEHVAQSSGQSRLIVMSSANAVADNFLQQFNTNVFFVANAVDMLALSDSLTGIRSSQLDLRPLKSLNNAQKQAVRWGNVLVVPILLVLLGVALGTIKNRRRHAIQTRYSSAQ